MVLNPEERKILLIEINGHSINPEEVREINIPEKNDCVWELIFKDDSTTEFQLFLLVPGVRRTTSIGGGGAAGQATPERGR